MCGCSPVGDEAVPAWIVCLGSSGFGQLPFLTEHISLSTAHCGGHTCHGIIFGWVWAVCLLGLGYSGQHRDNHAWDHSSGAGLDGARSYNTDMALPYHALCLTVSGCIDQDI
mmetsp:Transcript_11667/g.15203  ORF Transcript_11667/g.15203 Transcript_11667/m.15203 type:complete len:112 (+) Transcript_11667:573-908(+)